MNDDSVLATLARTWREEIPLAAAMRIEVDGFAGGELVVRAPLAPNRNLHHTAFAGALFSLCVLTAWGRVWLGLQERGATGLIVAADSRIEYRKAVTSDWVVCRCSGEPALDTYPTTGRASFTLEATVDGAGKPAVSFSSRFVVLAR